MKCRRLSHGVANQSVPRGSGSHLVVDHARQQVLATGVQHGFTCCGRQTRADFHDPALADTQVAFADAALVNEPRLLNKERTFGDAGSDPRSGTKIPISTQYKGRPAPRRPSLLESRDSPLPHPEPL